jgi:predicted nuclease of predicted toxin-antitoxin system
LAQGHDVVHVGDLGKDPGDVILLAEAVRLNRIFITIDTDFGTLVFRDGAAHRGIIRLPGGLANQRILIMQQLLLKHSAEMEAGAIITVKGNRIRINLPPSPHSPPAP